MEQKISEIINTAVKEENIVQNRWREPLVSFADAHDPMIKKLKIWIDEKHLLPQDLIAEAESVIVFYIPFVEDTAKSNRAERLASMQWTESYVETNKLINVINEKIKAFLTESGHKCETTPATHNFDPKELISYWSHRHLAYIAGMGTFGLNNMLITEKGSAGRFGSCVTSIKLEPGQRPEKENCLYKARGTCGACVKKCVNGALTIDGFDRFKCYEMLLENDAANKISSFTDVCGKCIAGMPCSNRNPVS